MNRSRLSCRLSTYCAGYLLACCLLNWQLAVAEVTQWVDIEINNGQLLVGTEIAGVSGRALLDTGAEINAINRLFVEAENLSFPKGQKVRISGVHKTSYRNSYRNVPVKIFGTELDFKDLVEIDLGSPETQLIIGAGFLKLFIFQFDYPNQRMRMITRDSLDLKNLSNVTSRKDPSGSSPIVKVRLNDEKDVWLTMDTGYNGGILVVRSLAKKQGWLDRYATSDSVLSGVNSKGRIQRFSLPVMEFGGFAIENSTVSVAAEGESMELFKTSGSTASRVSRHRGKARGVLGYDVLKHFVVTIDYQTGYVHLEHGSSSN